MNKTFSKTWQIRFADCDAAGIVYHPNFFVMFNGLIEDWFAEALEYRFENMAEHGVVTPVVSIKSDFFKPFTIGEHGELRLWVSHMGNSSFTVQIEFLKDEEKRVHCEETMVFVDMKTKKSTPIPADLRMKMLPFFKPSEA